MRLTTEQLVFLESQHVPLSRTFDASGMSRGEYQDEMKSLDLIVAYGVSACKAGGHTLRTRSGHCCQCNTAALAFLLRFEDRGEVYVASSAKQGLTKIGVAKDHVDRMRNLNGHGYGGTNDWIVRFCLEVDRAGLVEFRAHQNLDHFRTTRSYLRTGKTIECQELFICSVDIAVEVLIGAIASSN